MTRPSSIGSTGRRAGAADFSPLGEAAGESLGRLVARLRPDPERVFDLHTAGEHHLLLPFGAAEGGGTRIDLRIREDGTQPQDFAADLLALGFERGAGSPRRGDVAPSLFDARPEPRGLLSAGEPRRKGEQPGGEQGARDGLGERARR